MTNRLLSVSVLASCALASPCGPDAKVPCVKLGSGASMPMVAMGSWTGSAGMCTPGNFTCTGSYATSSLKSWLSMGGRHIDTANDYKNQVAIGQLLSNSGVPREDLFVTTKCPGTIGYEATIQCVDDNMQMLQLLTDEGKVANGYIDLVLIHFPFKTPLACRFQDIDACTDPDWLNSFKNVGKAFPEQKEAIQSTWRALEDLKKLGVLKSIGVSSYNAQHLQWTLDVATEPIDVNQVNWNPLVHDDEVLKFCKDHNIILQAWSPLGGSAAFNKRFGVDGSLLTHPTIKQIAASHGKSTAQVILRWSVQQGVAVTTSSSSPVHQEGDMQLFDFELSSTEMASIGALSGANPFVLCNSDADCTDPAQPVCKVTNGYGLCKPAALEIVTIYQ